MRSDHDDEVHHWREGWSSPSGGPETIGTVVPVVNVGGNFEAAPIRHGANFSRIRKRSYKRAVRRAQLHGETSYRGRRLVLHPPRLPVLEGPVASTCKSRIRFLSWNVGGLSDIIFTELKLWLQLRDNRDISIIILQETHWSFSGDWTDENWHFCHTATTRKGSGGILVGVRRDLANPEQIRWFEAEPGRLIQVRCFLGLQQLDIVGIYQHALLQTAGMTDAILDQRRKLLAKLDKLLSSLPVRSQLVVGGDFNATLVRENKVCGFGILARELTEKEKLDQDCFMRVLQRHRLTALNTWGSKKQAATYIHAKGRSQIDFLCARQAVADGEAKRAKAIMTTMAGWRTTGHRPLIGSIPHRWTPWKKTGREKSAGDRICDDGVMLCAQRTNMESATATKLRDAVWRTGGAAPEKIVRPALTPVDTAVCDSWKLRRRMKVAQSLLGAGFIFVFRYFRACTAYLRAHRLLKKALRDRKRQRTLTLPKQAEEAANRQDTRMLYGVVNLLCPKKGSQKIRLRDSEGNLMNGEAECQVLAEYARNLFMAPDHPRQELLRIPMEELRLERWVKAAQKLQAEKAAPHLTPPLRNWKQHSASIVPILHNIAVRHLCSEDPCIPKEWSEVQLAWLAKPRKCPLPGKPENGRAHGGGYQNLHVSLERGSDGTDYGGALGYPAVRVSQEVQYD